VAAPFVQDVARFLNGKREVVEPLLAGLRRQHERGALLATYCNGSYLFAEAGLLDGRLATTHWAAARDFEKRYPKARLQATEIVTEQERIICGGAVTSYLNVVLRLVARLVGEDLAAATARLMLIDQNKGSQASYAAFGIEEGLRHTDLLVAKAQRWMRANFREAFRLADLADQLGTSERTLNRRFKAAVGEAPLRHLQSMRVEAAKALLEKKRLSVDAVTGQVGYGDVGAFRQLFKRATGLSPREYQRRFARRGVRA
jgi:transcriptional regulator GlxA family with amidase domain